MKRSGLRKLGVLAATICLAASLSTGAQECDPSCQAMVPARCDVGEPVPFHGSYSGNCPNYYPSWYFGEGPGYSVWDGNHVYWEEGTYHWVFSVPTSGGTCTREGDIVIEGCPAVCRRIRVEVRHLGQTPYLEFGLPEVNLDACHMCSQYGPPHFPVLLEVWDGNGNLDGRFPSTDESIINYFPVGPPPYRWKYTVDPPGNTSCTLQGTSDTRACKQVGSLKICASSLAEFLDQDRYVFQGDPTINDVVFFTESLTFSGNPESGQGILTTDGLVQVASGPIKETLFSGVNLPIELNGNLGTLEPATADPNFQYGFTLGGVPLVAKGTPVEVGEDQVTVTPTFFAGIPPLFTLAEVKSTIVYPKGGWKELRGLSLVAAQVLQAPVVSVKGTYAPETGVFQFQAGIDFPFLPLPEVSGGFSLWHNCFNGWEVGGGGFFECDLAGGNGEVASAVLGMDHICDNRPFRVYINGTLALSGLAEDVLGLKGIGMEYEHPLVFRLNGGEVIFMTFPVGGMHGTLSLKSSNPGASFQWSANVMGVYQSDMNVLLSLNRKMFLITADGTLQIPDFSCGTFNIPCKVLRRAIKAAVTLPYEIQGVHKEGVIQKTGTGDWAGHLRGRATLGPLSAAAQLEFQNMSWSLLLGSDYQDLFEVGRVECSTLSPLAETKSVLVPAGRSAVLFAGASDVAVPVLYLQNPEGARITPETAGSFPGVTFLSDAEEGLAIFQVLGPTAGTWTLGQDGLPPEQVTLVALSPTPPPELAFTSVQRSGDTVSMAAAVSPTTPTSSISFLFAKNPEGLDGEWIAADLPAPSGTASTSWDTTGLESGTYYLLARTDDGLNPAVTAAYAEPIVVDHGTVLPPTGVRGARTGTEATLRWTASATPGPLQYQVLYTDSPDRPGYPLFRSAPMEEEILIEGLDEARAYKFCVVAYDGQGNRSVESAPWTSYPAGMVPGDCDGSGTVSIGEVQKAINMFLGSIPPGCGVDCNGDGTVSIGEVQKVINAFLGVASSC